MLSGNGAGKTSQTSSPPPYTLGADGVLIVHAAQPRGAPVGISATRKQGMITAYVLHVHGKSYRFDASQVHQIVIEQQACKGSRRPHVHCGRGVTAAACFINDPFGLSSSPSGSDTSTDCGDTTSSDQPASGQSSNSTGTGQAGSDGKSEDFPAGDSAGSSGGDFDTDVKESAEG
jgi:hypothetical protein